MCIQNGKNRIIIVADVASVDGILNVKAHTKVCSRTKATQHPETSRCSLVCPCVCSAQTDRYEVSTKSEQLFLSERKKLG